MRLKGEGVVGEGEGEEIMRDKCVKGREKEIIIV